VTGHERDVLEKILNALEVGDWDYACELILILLEETS